MADRKKGKRENQERQAPGSDRTEETRRTPAETQIEEPREARRERGSSDVTPDEYTEREIDVELSEEDEEAR